MIVDVGTCQTYVLNLLGSSARMRIDLLNLRLIHVIITSYGCEILNILLTVIFLVKVVMIFCAASVQVGSPSFASNNPCKICKYFARLIQVGLSDLCFKFASI
jgi:hypothetical protein